MFHPRLALLVDYVDRIDEPNRSAMRRLLHAEGERIALSPGSTHNHQTWPGGYVDHLIGMLEFARGTFVNLKSEPPFNFGDLVLVILLHDIEKPWKYVDVPEGTKRTFADRQEMTAFTEELIQRFGFVLSDTHRNALKYAHGEGEDYLTYKRVMNELGALLHISDVYSARVEYNRRILLPIQ